ncbi:MAG: hypothetical protein ACE5KE_03120 [Methanosarcinales archaeon]
MEEKGLIEVTNEIETEIETVDLMKCFEEGFPDSHLGHAMQLIKAINSYVSSQELRKGCNLKFLTNWIPNGKWKAGNDKYSFLVIFEEKELRRWDIGVKELTFLIPAMLKNKINDLRGRVLKIKKEKDERDRVNYLIEFLPKKVNEKE